MSDRRVDFRTRIKTRASKVAAPKKAPVQYVKSRALGDDEDMVYCKLCGIELFRIKNGKMLPNGNYTEVTLEFDNGEKHETSLCRGCAKGLTPKQAEFVYTADLQQWLREEQVMRTELHHDFLRIIADRTIRKISRGSRLIKKVA